MLSHGGRGAAPSVRGGDTRERTEPAGGSVPPHQPPQREALTASARRHARSISPRTRSLSSPGRSRPAPRFGTRRCVPSGRGRLPCISAPRSSSAEAGRKPHERFRDSAPALAAATSSAGNPLREGNPDHPAAPRDHMNDSDLTATVRQAGRGARRRIASSVTLGGSRDAESTSSSQDACRGVGRGSDGTWFRPTRR
jgi:hypothetical protein